MSDLFAASYREDWAPGAPACFDCIHVDNTGHGWREPSRCKLLAREIDRTIGRCDAFAEATP